MRIPAGAAPPPIAAVDISTAAFVGESATGAPHPPVLVTSARGLEEAFGAARGTLMAAAQHFFANDGRRLYLLGVDDLDADPGAALAALDDLGDVGLIACPGHASQAVVEAGAAYCERRADCFFLADTPAGAGPREARIFVESLRVRSAFAALYFPWLTAPEAMPASGFVAGVYARTDTLHGVWTAPAGRDAVVRGASGVARGVRDREQAELNPLGVNVIRTLEGVGPVVWGARTLASGAGGEWRYVPVRRTAIFLERSIAEGTSWTVFEPTGEPLWASLRLSISSFLEGQWRAGAFPADRSDEAFFVKCDRSTMTQADIDAGRVIVVVGFAPLRTAEFVILRFALGAAGGTDDP